MGKKGGLKRCLYVVGSFLPVFFGFLQMGEDVVPSNSSYDPEVHLTVGDIKINDRKKPSFLEVRIKASKTDVFRRGVTIYLGVTGVDICPVAAILSYMIHCSVMARGKQSPFFCFSNGRALTRDCFVRELRMAISAGGIDTRGAPIIGSAIGIG